VQQTLGDATGAHYGQAARVPDDRYVPDTAERATNLGWSSASRWTKRSAGPYNGMLFRRVRARCGHDQTLAYVAGKLADWGVRHVFLIPGGGSMHLNDSFGRESRIRYFCSHHEQASAMAASVTRVTGGRASSM
jgi:hypothetical protein